MDSGSNPTGLKTLSKRPETKAKIKFAKDDILENNKLIASNK